MVRSTIITDVIAGAIAQATGFTLFVYFGPPNPLHYPPSAFLTKQELLLYQDLHQNWAILFFLFIFSMSFAPLALSIWIERDNRSEQEDTLREETKEEEKSTKMIKSIKSAGLTKTERETNETKEARSTKIEQSPEEVGGIDEHSNLDEHIKTRVELLNTKIALKKEQERVDRIEKVMESLQAQVGVLRARLTVKDAEVKNNREKVQEIEEDRQRQADIFATRITTQESKMEEALERSKENESSCKAMMKWIGKLKRKADNMDDEFERFDGMDEEINKVYRTLDNEVEKIQETAKDNLEEFRADMVIFEDYWTEELQKIDDNRQSREWDLRLELKREIKEELRKEQAAKEIDEWWERRLAQVELTGEESMAEQDAKHEMEAESTNATSRVERSSQTDTETIETRVKQEVVGNGEGDHKQEVNSSAENETPIQEKPHLSQKAVENAMHSSLGQEKDAEMKDLEQGKNEAMEDITHELEEMAEVEETDGDLDEEWTELRY